MAMKTYLSEAPQKSSMLVRHWHELPRWWSLEVFKDRGDVALRGMVNGHGGGGLMVGLNNLCGLFKPQ